jgi:HEPN domain-containing protein
MKSPRELALLLLTKADHDLTAAKATIATGQALDTVCFHAQQAAEKSLKALLALRNIPYPYRHDMSELASLARKHFPAVALLEREILALTPYAVDARYDDTMEPSMEEARAALETASKTYAFTKEIVLPGG